jgi:hypothetical protein
MKQVLNIPGYGSSTLRGLDEAEKSGAIANDSEKEFFSPERGKLPARDLLWIFVEPARRCAAVQSFR